MEIVKNRREFGERVELFSQMAEDPRNNKEFVRKTIDKDLYIANILRPDLRMRLILDNEKPSVLKEA